MAHQVRSPVLRFLDRVVGRDQPGSSTDAELLERFVVGRDQAAFELLVWRHERMVLGVCRRILGDPQDVEDAFQSTFLVFVRKAKAIRKRDAVASWLYGVACRCARKARGRAHRHRQELHGRDLTTFIAPDDGLEAVEHRDTWRVLDEEVQRLPEKYRAPVVLCYLEGKTTEEAAKYLSCHRTTVFAHLAKAREILWGRLAARGVALSAGAFAGLLCVEAAAAAVPAALVQATVKTAAQYLAGGNAAAAGVSAPVKALTEGVLKTMALTKLKIAALVVVAVALAVGGIGAGIHAAAGNLSDPKAEPGQVAAEADKANGGARPQAPQRDVAADRAQSKENLKRIGEALHKFHDSHKHFPTAAIFSKDEKPLLSWRVAILCNLGEEALYKEFKLDEPWDSPHNKKLLAKMPKVYAPPGVQTKEPHATFYQVFFGKGSVFEGCHKIAADDVTDGTVDTIMAIEAGEAVPWTKPQDLAFDKDKALPKLGGIFGDDIHFVAVDGSVHTAKKGFDPKKMRAAITRAGANKGEGATDLKDLDP